MPKISFDISSIDSSNFTKLVQYVSLVFHDCSLLTRARTAMCKLYLQFTEVRFLQRIAKPEWWECCAGQERTRGSFTSGASSFQASVDSPCLPWTLPFLKRKAIWKGRLTSSHRYNDIVGYIRSLAESHHNWNVDNVRFLLCSHAIADIRYSDSQAALLHLHSYQVAAE